MKPFFKGKFSTPRKGKTNFPQGKREKNPLFRFNSLARGFLVPRTTIRTIKIKNLIIALFSITNIIKK